MPAENTIQSPDKPIKTPRKKSQGKTAAKAVNMDKEAIETLAIAAGQLLVLQARVELANYTQIKEARKLELEQKQVERATAEANERTLRLQVTIDREKRRTLKREWKVLAQEGMDVD